MILAAAGVVIYARLARRYPRYGQYLLVPVFYAMLILAFYVGVVLREFGLLTGVSFGDLSAWLRLVEILVLVGFGALVSAERITVYFGRRHNGN